MISKITSVDLANEIIINRIVNDEKNFYSLDKYTHHAITGDRISFLRDSVDLEYDEFVRRYMDSFGQVPDTALAFNSFTIAGNDAKNYVVYPFSRVNLYKNIFPDVLPSLFLSYFNLMKNNKRLYQIGTGVGKALIISVVPFTKKDLSDLKLMSYQDTVELMVLVSDQIAGQNTDIEYLLEKVDQITKEKEVLALEILRLNQAIINASITTWR